MGVKGTNPNATQDRSFISDLAITVLTTWGKPELDKLFAGVIARVGKDKAGPVLKMIQASCADSLKKAKIK